MGKKTHVLVVSTDHPSSDARVFFKCVLPLARNYVVHYAWDERFDNGDSLKPFLQEEGLDVFLYPIKRSLPGWRGRLEMLNEIVALSERVSPQVAHLHCGPLTLWLAKKMKKKSDLCVIYDAHEWDPESFSRIEKLKRLSVLMRFLTVLFEKLYVSHVDLIITVTWGIRRYWRNMHNAPPVIVIPNVLKNFSCKKMTSNVFRMQKNEFQKTRKLVFIGYLIRNRFLEECVRIVARINEKGFPCQLELCGNFPDPEYEKEFHSFLLKKSWGGFVVFKGFVPLQKIEETIQGADFGLNLLKDSSECKISLPNKIFTYAQAGIPTLCADYLEEARLFLTREGAGVFVNPFDVEKAADTVVEVFKDGCRHEKLKQNASLLAQKYSWINYEKALLASYSHLLGPEEKTAE